VFLRVVFLFYFYHSGKNPTKNNREENKENGKKKKNMEFSAVKVNALLTKNMNQR
jgi:hypothetical protein